MIKRFKSYDKWILKSIQLYKDVNQYIQQLLYYLNCTKLPDISKFSFFYFYFYRGKFII